MKKLSTYLGRYWYGYLFAIVCMVAAIVLDMIYPKITQSIVDDVMIGGQMQLLKGLLIGIVLVGVGRCAFGYFKEFTFDVLCSKIGSQMRKDLFHHIQTLSMDYFDNTNTGELMARVKDDIDKVWNALGYVGMLVIEVTIHVSIVLYCMFSLNWKMTFIPLATMIACGVIAIVMERKLDKVYEDISEENAVLTTVAEENLAGVRTVKAFAREKHEIAKFLSHNKRYYELNIRQSKVLVRYYPMFSFVGKMLPVAMTVVGGFSVLNQTMTLGALVAYVEYSRNCTWPMEMLGWLTNDLSSAIASYKKIKKIYAQTSSIKEKENPVHLDEVKGEITFEHVDFEIEDAHILKDVSFDVKPGATIGIMGATGSGKSSIVNLMQRFYDVKKGSVKLDGVDVRDLSLEQLRSSISVVMQDVFLFSDTIEENIKMGLRKQLPMDDIKDAAERAQAKGFIENMEEQYETVVGERGVGLSGGQKQRISIARALAKKKPILVMDDSTSALDMETEHEIQKMLNELDSTTKVIIAHRISAVRHADEIIYLEDGKIAERGTHEELLARKGLYYNTYMAQYGKFLSA
ncbi:MAG: ABC transporter ATP-binding protein/permease [Roseburia sp.]|uniref:ABC transporter ATP-binding protein n=1 Tax=Roseburia sp. 831b TaxID=1261635 RepID=UPI00095209FB|nr:ABC transporter ATP-binding protein [Roseburia sp. 831b]MCI5918764.1 ABC transporter ATP-binding protein/permease [Roseburia sp.]MDD6216087.1 ABC transporter ATP-binding protein [Roseburia sp.]MDY5884076.1 ABC transporter ATP-binding protein [Roseburia sp.]WVK73066.1 ABC transporter ATP-binding protein [Roseburia sp. 831b]